MQKTWRHLALITTLVLAIAGCDNAPRPKAGEGGGKYGMMDTNTPEFAAVRFFQHIYEDDTIDGAMSMSTRRMAKLLKSYHTPRNFQRHVLNLTYDTVDIQPDTGNTVGRNEFAKDAVVTVFFTGERHGDQIEDLRVVEMVRLDKKWLVDEIRADKYL
ncbi:hypothetical protein LJ739_05095 [Aestuariibacter halophilus]|uniref:Lipoprotein n=1 Tax=Fluctibacter halophilus TaxID=226011 RepID=A0ABS8G4V3_9ALTE|nr:hypothetical protein [Aestuariibacter halophilus]MCC2615612.1 hypothetical protein [Aestuariibacter halophilus]